MRVEWYIGDFSDPEAVSGSSTRSKRGIARQRCGLFFVGAWIMGVSGGWHRARLEAHGGAPRPKDECEGGSRFEMACRA